MSLTIFCAVLPSTQPPQPKPIAIAATAPRTTAALWVLSCSPLRKVGMFIDVSFPWKTDVALEAEASTRRERPIVK